MSAATLPRVVGHRGAAAVVPENTVASFRRGVIDGAPLLECDVHLSADGHDVVIHDATIDRTAQADSPLRTGAVASLTRAALDTVLVGEGEHIPTLAQVLDAAVRADGTRVPLLVEVKAPAAAAVVARILRERFAPAELADPETSPAWVISFDAEALRTVRGLLPEVPLLLTSTVATPELLTQAEELGVAQIGLRIADARAADVERCRALGVQLNLWTARSEVELDRALELGCDTITVDDPAWALELLGMEQRSLPSRSTDV
ncbi:glycerophosphodiester phosphodiesterase [Brachybacterium hainanense]|uniref:Glycerophosphodiester phosphodiesterase n=1 Tax=Brachybacterium hainanense TaxID=1541174 RepID=A0ABV6R9K1_9MICO